MMALGRNLFRGASGTGRPFVRRTPGPTLDRLEPRALMAVSLSASPIRATANATTGLIPVATIGVFQAVGAPISPDAPGTALVSWGDGTSSTAVVQVNTIYRPLNYAFMGRFGSSAADNGAVLAAHTYARAGTYPIGVTLTDPAGQTSATSTTAAVAGKSGSGLGVAPTDPISVAAGTPTGLVPVASFADLSAKPLKASAYKAQIAWGDGARSAGVVRVIPGGRVGGQSSATVEVLGSHAFSGAFPVSGYVTGIAVGLSRAGARATTNTVADVTGVGNANAGPITPLATGPLTVRRGRATGPLTVARFQAVNLGGTPSASNYTAQIAWGDGSTGAGSVSVTPVATVYALDSLVLDGTLFASTASNSTIRIAGRHTYRRAGIESVVTTVGGLASPAPVTTVVRVK